ncbi:NAD-dependent protein deacetylase hst4 [Astathelohania contejeani]|uniref:NAD-dependent protein deacetylase hst4 n=1 Tax=Astathelohania contejeani TaxID=164912 RepID=A0ABQ7HWH7_9MICR|nr:NAD-dependent protein deacetylase hst4 [Thelohania contejeani]
MKFITSKWIKANPSAFKNKKVVIITGAGISVNSGIADFRSKDGIFEEIKNTLKIRGVDFFNYYYSISPETRGNYLKMIAKLKEKINTAKPSLTHKFIPKLMSENKKGRLYSQNIDSLEEKCGMRAEHTLKTQLVYLHGHTKELKCNFCGFKIPFGSKEIDSFKNEDEIPCEACIKRLERRRGEGKRTIPTGNMHTQIIHYYQTHPDGQFIADLMKEDMDCNLLLVMGTSLKVYGLKRMVKQFGRAVKENKGLSFYINKEEPSKEFLEVFDYMWKGDCDEFCEELRAAMELEYLDHKMGRVSIDSSISELVNESFMELSITEKTEHENSKKEESIKLNGKEFSKCETKSPTGTMCFPNEAYDDKVIKENEDKDSMIEEDNNINKDLDKEKITNEDVINEYIVKEDLPEKDITREDEIKDDVIKIEDKKKTKTTKKKEKSSNTTKGASKSKKGCKINLIINNSKNNVTSSDENLSNNQNSEVETQPVNINSPPTTPSKLVPKVWITKPRRRKCALKPNENNK